MVTNLRGNAKNIIIKFSSIPFGIWSFEDESASISSDTIDRNAPCNENVVIMDKTVC